MTTQATFRNEVRAVDAANFVAAAADNLVYAVIGREDDPQGDDPDGNPYNAADGLWPDDDNPPAPSNTITERRIFWSTAIGAKKVLPADVALLVPRIDWETGTTYDVIDEESATWYDGEFYVRNSVDEVFICVVQGGGTSTDEPLMSGASGTDSTYYKDGKVSLFVGADGYTWKYIYKLTSYQINNLLDADWLPVPYGASLWTPDSDPERTKGRDDAYALLNAHHVMVSVELDAGADGSGKLPSGLKYRQMGLVVTPVETGDDLATDSVYFQKNSINGSVSDDLQQNRGLLIYYENRSPILREATQSELFRRVLVF